MWISKSKPWLTVGQVVGVRQQVVREKIGNLVFETQNYIIYLGGKTGEKLEEN